MAYGILAAFVIYLLSATHQTTHLDLLLDTPTEILWNILKLPRAILFAVGPWVLVILHFTAMWNYQRALDQLSEYWRALPRHARENAGARLSGNLVVELVFSRQSAVAWRLAAGVILGIVLLVAPPLTLLFAQSVTLPRQSEVLTWSIRAALLLDLSLIVVWAGRMLSARADWRDTGTEASFVSNARHLLALTVTSTVATVVAFVSCTVFTFPGEWLERKLITMAEMVTSEWVSTGQAADGDTTYWAFGAQCLVQAIDSGWGGTIWNTSYPIYKATSVYANEILKSEDPKRPYPIYDPATSYPLSSCVMEGPGLVHQVVIGTHLREWFGRRASRALDLAGVNVTGRGLSPVDRAVLGSTSRTVALDSRFSEVMQRIEVLDLTERPLAYANFRTAWLPKARIEMSRARGAVFHDANLQGAVLLNVRDIIPRYLKKANGRHGRASPYPSVFRGANLAHAVMQGAMFEDVDFTAVGVGIQMPLATFHGGRIRDSDLRFANLGRVRLLMSLQEDETATATEVRNVRFGGATLDDSFWQGALCDECDFTGASFRRATMEDGAVLKSSGLQFTDLSHVSFTNVFYRNLRLGFTFIQRDGREKASGKKGGLLWQWPPRNGDDSATWLGPVFTVQTGTAGGGVSKTQSAPTRERAGLEGIAKMFVQEVCSRHASIPLKTMSDLLVMLVRPGSGNGHLNLMYMRHAELLASCALDMYGSPYPKEEAEGRLMSGLTDAIKAERTKAPS